MITEIIKGEDIQTCPVCGTENPAKVYKTYKTPSGAVVRYRKCRACGENLPSEVVNFTTRGKKKRGV